MNGGQTYPAPGLTLDAGAVRTTAALIVGVPLIFIILILTSL